MEIRIQGMTCEHCVSAVRGALADVDGVMQVVEVDLDQGTARIEGNPEPGALIAAVEAEGYSASLA